MQWLMRLVLVREIGIPDDTIASGVRLDRSLEAASHQFREIKPQWFALSFSSSCCPSDKLRWLIGQWPTRRPDDIESPGRRSGA